MKKKIVLMTMMTAAAAGVMLAGCNGGATPAAQTPEDTMALQAASAIQQAAVLAPSAGLRAAVLPSVDFTFNLGAAALAKSTLLAKIRMGASETEIRKEFSRWVYANKVKLAGLVRRRQWEADRFFGKED